MSTAVVKRALPVCAPASRTRSARQRSKRNASGTQREPGTSTRVGYAFAASIAVNDATLIGERVATHGRSATDGGDERASVKSRHSFERQALVVSRRYAHGERRDQGRARSSMTYGPAWASRGRLGRRNDAPRIGERGATHGRIATRWR
jgi:hypothetical protein